MEKGRRPKPAKRTVGPALARVANLGYAAQDLIREQSGRGWQWTT